MKNQIKKLEIQKQLYTGNQTIKIFQIKMGGKKALVIGIIVAFIAIVAYFIFSGSGDESESAKTFSGSNGKGLSASQQKAMENDGSRNFRDEQRKLKEQERVNGKNGGGNTVINKINNITIEKDGSSSSSSSSPINNKYTYNIAGSSTTSNQYSQNTQFAISDGKGDIKDYSDDVGGGNAGDGGSGESILTRKLSSAKDLENTELFQACIKIVTSILNEASPSYTKVQTALAKLSGFNLLAKLSQDSIINDITSRKYGSDAKQYCMDIVSAIEDAISNLEIYKQCIETVGKILAKTSPTKTEIKVTLAEITGFSLLPEIKQSGFVNDLYSKKHGDNAKLYCLDIVSAIIDVINDMALYKQCISTVSPLLTNPSVTAQTVKTALMTLTGFTMITEEKQQEFINDIVTKKHGDNAAKYCMDIVSAIIDATDPAQLFKLCMSAMGEILKEHLAGNTITEELILLKLSVMRIFNGIVEHEQRKVVAQSYFGTEYNKIVADIKTINSLNFDKKASEVCAKIVSAITDAITGENIYGECILTLNKAKQSSNVNTTLADILPYVSELDFQSQHTIENMFKAFLQGNNVTAEEICTFLVKELADGDSLDDETNGNSSDGNSENDKDSSSSDDDNAEHPCVTLVDLIDTEYQVSVSSPGSNSIDNIIKKIPSFEFYIPEASKAAVIQKTLFEYLSKPTTDAEGKTYHRDEMHQMNDDNLELFSQLSLHERSTISERLYDLSYTVASGSTNHVSTVDIQKEVYPNLCKCSHPDFDNAKWNSTLTNYFANKQVGLVTDSLPNDEIEKSIAIVSSPFYTKCTTTGISTLSSSDTTSASVLTKMKANLSELSQFSVTQDDIEPLTCYATECQNGCSVSCEESVQSVCETLTEKYLTQVPQNDPISNDQIFTCEANAENSYNMIYLHCLETATAYYSTTNDKEKFLAHCQKSIETALTEYQNNASSLTIPIIKEYLSDTSGDNYTIFTSLSDNDKQVIASGLYNKIQIGEINYNQTIEKSCHQVSENGTEPNRTTLAEHFTVGVNFFIEDASAIRAIIVEELWDLNEKERMMKNRSITYEKCIEIADAEWKKLLVGNQNIRSGSKEDLALPPSPQCKCYIQQIFLTLHGKAIQDTDECNDIISEVTSKIDTLTALSQKSSSGLPSTGFYKIVSLIPHFEELPYNVKSEMMQSISSDLADTRANTPTTSTIDSGILLTSAQKNTHCTTISTNIGTFTATEKYTCIIQLGKVSYENTKTEGSNSNNLICNLFGESLKKASDDAGHMSVFPEDNDQLNDMRLSTCTQKLRAVYMQIEAMQASYWEDTDYDWTLENQCSQESGYIIDMDTFANEFNSNMNIVNEQQ